MGTFQKLGVMALGVAAITTLVLPARQTTALFSGGTKLLTGTTSTVMGTSSGAVG